MTLFPGKAAAAILLAINLTAACGPLPSMPPGEEQRRFEVRFHDRTPLDEPASHLTLLYREPVEELVLPKPIGAADAWFFNIYYTRTETDDSTISAMMIPSPDHDTFFIDLTNDEDLTNDGDPLIMAKTDNAITFEIVAPSDPRQRTVVQLNRLPVWMGERDRQLTFEFFFDDKGDLLPDNASRFSLRRTDFATRSGLFLFDRRVGLARGELPVGDEVVAIGIFDFDNNGLFNDPDDLVVVDRDRDGLLTVLFSTEGFAIDDPFAIDDTWFRLVEPDRYGERAVFEIIDPPADTGSWANVGSDATSEPDDPTAPSGQVLVSASTSRPGAPGVRVGRLEPDFWTTTFEGTRSEVLRAEDYRGHFLLLNFWGEWCGPRIAEIPDLVAASSRYSDAGLRIISFLESQSPGRAAEILATFNADWPQVTLTDDLRKRFHITAFPTNVLILPDGSTYLRTFSVDEKFFETSINREIAKRPG